jgi:C1A family cysteine protease
MAEKLSVAAVQTAIQKAGESWQAGTSLMSELPREEQLKHLGVELPAGLTTEEAELQIRASRAALRTARSIGAPAAYDWRNVNGQNFVTDVKDQGGCGSCVAFGTTAVVETALRIQRGAPNLVVDLSEAQLFYCHARSQGRNCGNGWFPDQALEFFKNQGVADEACYPYTSGDQDCSNLCADWQNRATKVTGYHQVGSVAEMKEWLSTRGAITGCFYVFDDFFSYRSGVYRHVTGELAGGHCVVIVGYDDAESCWICKNSWGPSWGDNGFFRIGYGECEIETWFGPYAVDGIVETGWLSSKTVTGLWSINEDRNAWVYLSESVGWRRIAFDNDNVFVDQLVQLTTAKAANRPVDVYQNNGVITQVYVL